MTLPQSWHSFYRHRHSAQRFWLAENLQSKVGCMRTHQQNKDFSVWIVAEKSPVRGSKRIWKYSSIKKMSVIRDWPWCEGARIQGIQDVLQVDRRQWYVKTNCPEVLEVAHACRLQRHITDTILSQPGPTLNSDIWLARRNRWRRRQESCGTEKQQVCQVWRIKSLKNQKMMWID